MADTITVNGQKVPVKGGPGGYEATYKSQTFWAFTKSGLEAKLKKAGEGFKSNRGWWM